MLAKEAARSKPLLSNQFFHLRIVSPSPSGSEWTRNLQLPAGPKAENYFAAGFGIGVAIPGGRPFVM